MNFASSPRNFVTNILCLQHFESHMKIANLWAARLWKIFTAAEKIVLLSAAICIDLSILWIVNLMFSFH
jgi:hypothetical protein